MKTAVVSVLLLSLSVGILSSGIHAEPRNTSYIYPPWKHTWGVRRATPFKLRLFAGNKTHFDNPQGLACARLDTWEDTTKTSDDDELTVYGINSGDNCIVYNRSMYSLGIYGLDKDHEKFDRPWGIAVDCKGNVYVADRGNARIVKLFNPQNKLQFTGIIGGPGEEPGLFIEPRGVALDTDGRLYVTDSALGRISVFDENGSLVDTLNGFDGPDGIAVVGPEEEWSYFRNDNFIIVIDSLHQRVRKLDLNGELVGETSAREWNVENAYLGYVTIDYYNNIILTDMKNGCLHKLNHNLTYLTRFGEPGRNDYQFDEPRGITTYRRFGQIIVAEREGAQYLWVGVDVSRLTAEVKTVSVWSDLMIDFNLTEPAFCDMDIVDSYGRFIARVSTSRRFPAGSNHIAWAMVIPGTPPKDLHHVELPPEFKRGERLPAGDYAVRASFRATYSSREHFTREAEAKFRMKD